MSTAASLARLWHARSLRERRIVGGGAIVLVLLLAYGWLWRPLSADLARMEDQLPRLRSKAQQIEQASAEIEKLRSRPPTGTTGPNQMPAVVARSAADSGLAGGSFTFDAANRRAKASFDRIGFDAWAAWVDQLHRTHRLVLTAARVEAVAGPGWVRVECEFTSATDTR